MWRCSVKFFSKFIYLFVGYFDPVNIYILMIKINNFRGDFSDISAKTATLALLQGGTLVSLLHIPFSERHQSCNDTPIAVKGIQGDLTEASGKLNLIIQVNLNW